MRLFLLISVFVGSASAQCHFCSGVCVFDEFEDIMLVKSGLPKVIDIAYSDYLNTVFFTYEDFNKPPVKRLGYVKLASGNMSYVPGLRDPHGVTIDVRYNILYVGTAVGLYKLALYTKVLSPVIVGPSVRMTSVFYYKENVYFITINRKAVKLQMNLLVVMPAIELQQWKMDKMIVDKHENLLYIDYEDNRVYRIQQDISDRVMVPDSDNATDIALDKDHNAYLAKPDGIYKYHGLTGKLKYLGDNFANVQRMTFYKENDPIYNVDDKIMKLSHKRDPRASRLKS